MNTTMHRIEALELHVLIGRLIDNPFAPRAATWARLLWDRDIEGDRRATSRFVYQCRQPHARRLFNARANKEAMG